MQEWVWQWVYVVAGVVESEARTVVKGVVEDMLAGVVVGVAAGCDTTNSSGLYLLVGGIQKLSKLNQIGCPVPVPVNNFVEGSSPTTN